MATIKLKTSTTDAAVPASLSKGEVAINVSDGVWYYGGASAVQQNFKFGSATVTGNTSLDGKLVVTGNTVLNGTLSATTSVHVGNGNGTISASSVTGTILKGVLGSDATPVTAYINGGEIDNVAIGSETRLTSLKTTSIDINPSDAATVAFLLTANADAEGNWVTINNSEDEAKFEIDSAGRTTIAQATLTSGNITSANIDGGNIDGTAIGTSSRSTGKFTTMDVNSTLVVTGNTVLNGTLSATTSLKVGNGDGTISAATITSSGDMTSGGDVYTDVVRRQSDSSTTTKIKLDDETIKCFGSSSSVWSTKVSSQQLEVGQGGAGVISAATVTGLGFVGTKHVLRSYAFYVNDNPMLQNNLYFGSSLGNTPSNWQDPFDVGGTITSVPILTIIEDDMNWGTLLPFDVSKVEVQCSLRPNLGTGDDFTIVMYTGIRSDNSNTDLTLTSVASGQTTFTTQRYRSNDITYTANLNAGTMIYVGVGSEDATDAKNARGIMNIVVTQR